MVLGLLLASLSPPVRAVDLDKLAPGDAEAVLVINVKNYLDSVLFKKYSEEKTRQALKTGSASKFLEDAAFDPLKDVDSITVTFANVTGKEDMKACVIVRGKLNAGKLEKAIKDAAKQSNDALKIATEEGQTYYTLTPPQGQQIIGTFVGNETMVVSNNPEYLKEIVGEKKIEPTAGARVLKAAIGRLPGKETVVFAAALTAELKEKLGEVEAIKGLVEKLDTVSGSVNIDTSMDVTLALNAFDQASAKNLGVVLKQTLPILKVLSAGNEVLSPQVELLLEHVKVTWEGKVIYLKAQFSDEALASTQERVQKAQVKNILAAANTALKEMKWERAKELFSIILRIDPENADGKKGVEKTKALANGYAALNEKQWSEAEEAFKAALKIDPESTVGKEGLQKAREKKQ